MSIELSIKLLHNLLQVQHIISGKNVSRGETEGRKKPTKNNGEERRGEVALNE